MFRSGPADKCTCGGPLLTLYFRLPSKKKKGQRELVPVGYACTSCAPTGTDVGGTIVFMEGRFNLDFSELHRRFPELAPTSREADTPQAPDVDLDI